MIGICTPYRNRENYLPIFLAETSAYLARHYPQLDYRFFIGQQLSGRLFNGAAARNVAARGAIEAGCTYLVFMDVDTFPVNGVDWKPQPSDLPEMWFQHSGGSRMHPHVFLTCNGWNINFAGWGEEDTEFYHRLRIMGDWELYGWREALDYDQRNKAVVCNLEFDYTPGSLDEQWRKARDHANYWWNGPHSPSHRGPWFVSYEMLLAMRDTTIYAGDLPSMLERHPRTDGWREPRLIGQNEARWHKLLALPEREFIEQAYANGYAQTPARHKTYPVFQDRCNGIEFTCCRFDGE